ncbi:transcriptional regulator with XRE-family HTH domain [Bacillus sp. SORGH_AS 510]|uniref:helix-turn-helix domain-containing protein n=1 Tax=Bacillus sp. SORGH_AS_0510 TaxID=3041771 RepID=UPI0027836A92|nr:helix-turn-helix transcriptional regulator [Bacillus sp. SORGH_AS_0510]MDQ1143778.1 transcriptional regulator with XRE-family HTH domain [Bacillus sp. SORGH_AS_0510]
MKHRRKYFGKLLKKYRKAMAITQQDFASDCSLSISYVSKLERNIQEPSLGTIFIIASQLGIKASELIAQLENSDV